MAVTMLVKLNRIVQVPQRPAIRNLRRQLIKNQLQSFIKSRLGEGGGGSLVVGGAAEDPDTVLENITAAANTAGQAAYDASVAAMSTKNIGAKYSSKLRTESKVFGRKWTETIKQ